MSGFLGLLQSRKNAGSLLGMILVAGAWHYIAIPMWVGVCMTVLGSVAILSTAWEDVRKAQKP